MAIACAHHIVSVSGYGLPGASLTAYVDAASPAAESIVAKMIRKHYSSLGRHVVDVRVHFDGLRFEAEVTATGTVEAARQAEYRSY